VTFQKISARIIFCWCLLRAVCAGVVILPQLLTLCPFRIMNVLEKPSSLFLHPPMQDQSQPHAAWRGVRQFNLASFRMHRLFFFLIVVICTVQFLISKFVLVMDFATSANNKVNTSKVLTIPFVVTITECGYEYFPAYDGAAVLGHSIHQNSIHGPNGGRYDYQLYVFHHPNASECALPLAQLGFIVQERDTPVALADIQNVEFLDDLRGTGFVVKGS
jgi:hypothetical protein